MHLPDAAPEEPLRPVWAEIERSAISANVSLLAAHAAGAEVMAVVKSDGYGHGAVTAARAAIVGGATRLGVALVEEGLALRRAGIDVPILVMSEPPPRAAVALVSGGLTPTVYTPRFAAALLDAANGATVEAHVKLDTGMRRVGIPEAEWSEALAALAALPALRVTGLWSHLAVADEPGNPETDRQAERFERGCDLAARAGLRPRFRHLCNSAGTILRPDLHLDIVRPGVAIYGMEPAPGVWLEGLRPALSLRAELTLVKPLRAGCGVSYGHRWSAPADTVVGTIGVGYGDGVRRGLGNRAAVVHRGRRVPIVGAVCMDQLIVDLGPAAEAAPGDEVWLLGGPSEDAISAAEWAAWLDTITYEVTCGLTARLPRRDAAVRATAHDR